MQTLETPILDTSIAEELLSDAGLPEHMYVLRTHDGKYIYSNRPVEDHKHADLDFLAAFGNAEVAEAYAIRYNFMAKPVKVTQVEAVDIAKKNASCYGVAMFLDPYKSVIALYVR